MVYLRSPEGWLWTGTGGSYFDALALSATVFTLILSFRVARLAGRTRDEDNRTFALFHRLEQLVRRDVLEPEVLEHVIAIDSSRGSDLEKAYDGIRECIADALDRTEDPADRRELIAAQAGLNPLVHSRMQGINFGELCSLCVFAGITIGLALCSRPGDAGLTGFLTEMFTTLFSAVIVFLTANVWDLQSERDSRILERGVAGHRLVFAGGGSRFLERLVAVVLGLAVSGGFACLLGVKWLGWFGVPW